MVTTIMIGTHILHIIVSNISKKHINTITRDSKVEMVEAVGRIKIKEIVTVAKSQITPHITTIQVAEIVHIKLEMMSCPLLTTKQID